MTPDEAADEVQVVRRGLRALATPLWSEGVLRQAEEALDMAAEALRVVPKPTTPLSEANDDT